MNAQAKAQRAPSHRHDSKPWINAEGRALSQRTASPSPFSPNFVPWPPAQACAKQEGEKGGKGRAEAGAALVQRHKFLRSRHAHGRTCQTFTSWSLRPSTTGSESTGTATTGPGTGDWGGSRRRRRGGWGRCWRGSASAGAWAPLTAQWSRPEATNAQTAPRASNRRLTCPTAASSTAYILPRAIGTTECA